MNEESDKTGEDAGSEIVEEIVQGEEQVDEIKKEEVCGNHLYIAPKLDDIRKTVVNEDLKLISLLHCLILIIMMMIMLVISIKMILTLNDMMLIKIIFLIIISFSSKNR